MDAARGHRSIFPYDGMIRIRFTGESAVSLSLSRIGPTPRRSIYILPQTGGIVNWESK